MEAGGLRGGAGMCSASAFGSGKADAVPRHATQLLLRPEGNFCEALPAGRLGIPVPSREPHRGVPAGYAGYAGRPRKAVERCEKEGILRYRPAGPCRAAAEACPGAREIEDDGGRNGEKQWVSARPWSTPCRGPCQPPPPAPALPGTDLSRHTAPGILSSPAGRAPSWAP